MKYFYKISLIFLAKLFSFLVSQTDERFKVWRSVSFLLFQQTKIDHKAQ